MADTTPNKTLGDLKAWLQAIGTGKPVPLTADGFTSPMVGNFFKLVGVAELTIEGNNQQIGDKNVVVTGTCTFLGYNGLKVTATFTQDDSAELAMAVTLALDPSVQWSLLDVLPVHIEKTSLLFQPDTALKVFTLDLSADLVAKTLSLPIGLRIPTYDGDWEVYGEFGETGQGFSIDDLIALAAGQDALSQLPSDLQVLASLAIREVQMAFNPHAKSVTYVSILLGFNQDWSFFSGGLVASGITLDVVVPFSSGAPRTPHVTLAGTISIDGVPVNLGAQFPEMSLWAALDEKHPLKLNSVFSYLKITLPDGFPDIEITRLGITFDLSNEAFVFDLAISGEIPFVPGLISLDSLAIQVAKQGSNAATGTFVIMMAISDAWLMLSAAYDGAEGGLKLKGSAADISMADFNAYLVEKYGVSMPKSLLSVTIKKLDTSYDTSTKAFHFEIEGDLTVESQAVVITALIDISPATAPKEAAQGNTQPGSTGGDTTGKFTSLFGGTLQVGNLLFTLAFEKGADTSDSLVASYSHKDGDPDKTSLRDLVAGISTDLAQAVPDGIEIQLKDVKFVFYRKADTSKQFAFGLDLALSIDLSHLPVVGSKLPPDVSLNVNNLQGIYSSNLFDATQVGQINVLLPSSVTPFPSDGMSQGINMSADVLLGSKAVHLAMGVPQQETVGQPSGGEAAQTGGAKAVGPPAAPAASSALSSTMKWIDVQKQFGIFQFDRIGAGYENNILSFALDAAVSLGPLTFSMDGLSVGSPLNRFEPVFDLKGLGLDFKKPSLEIGGAFVKTSEQANGKTITSYYGEVIVKTASFSLKAIGGWAPEADPASFFIYVNVDVPLGGPPFLFITGLAGGLGINRSLKLPTIDEIATYPLLPNNAPQPAGSPSDTIAKVLPELQSIFVNNPGEYWLAAGIQFTSFEMIDAFVLVTVAFGVDLQIAVLGSCAMTFPKGDPYPVAYVEVDLIASFTPSTGLLAVDGKLSPSSFIYGGFCKLYGGFAFYAWFAGDNQGNFVVTIGGYHPAFNKPDYYPSVPRLGMNFALGPFQVTGEAYFALTPSMMMAGVRMSAVWSSGPIKAWLDAGVDFLISWAPFHYEADAFINLGCSVDLGLFTINVHIGADIYIWGPAFGGQAHIDLDVVSFTIAFGAEAVKPPPVGWNTFKSKFLPQDSQAKPPVATPQITMMAFAATPSETITNIIKASVPTGLLQSDVAGFNWILDPDHFGLLTNSTIPANNGEWALSTDKVATLPNIVSSYTPPQVNVTAGPYLELPADTRTFSASQVWNPTVDIGPMEQESVQSYQTIQVCKRKDSDPVGVFSEFITDLSVTPVLLPSNTALWAKNNADKAPNDPLLMPSALTGFLITPIPRTPAQVNDVPLIQLLFGEGFSTGFRYQQAAVNPNYTVTASINATKQLVIGISGQHTATLTNSNYILSSLLDSWITNQRASIVDDLTKNGFSTYKSSEIDLEVFATQTTLTDWPAVEMLGS
jgi:uncharacterized protein DUF6603